MELPGKYAVDMEIAKQLFNRLRKWEYFGLCLLLLVTLALHFSVIMQPAEVIFDEKFYVEDANSILQGDGTLRPEHPPLGKLFISFGILLFGDNPLGWRFFSVLLGTICIVLLYLICRRLELPKGISLIVASLLALENLSFIQASVAMLDVFSLTFMLLSFWLYLRGQYLLSGVSVALSALAKLTGGLALPVILLHWLLTKRGQPIKFVATILATYISFLLLMPLFDYVAFGEFLNPIGRIYVMLSSSTSLTFVNVDHIAASRPWDWVLRPEIMFYWYTPRYIGAISFTVWALIIPAVTYMTFRATKGNTAGIFGISWFASTYLIWIPISLIIDRVSFIYYFYPSIGAVCIGLGLGLSQLLTIWKTRGEGKLRWVAMLTVMTFLLLHVGVFVIMSPVFNLPVIPIPMQ